MGSLPNLNELERAARRDFERERGIARERARERDFSRDKSEICRERDKLPIFIHQTPLPKHNQHYRHSLTSRKVLRTRSSGTTHHIWDDPMIEHMAAYSPISSRSHRTGIAPLPYQLQQQQQQPLFSTSINRRRESANSSIGATSVRRLLAVNRGCRHKIPVHVRAKIIKNFILLVVAHALGCAVLIPIFGLQGSNSIWFNEENYKHFGSDTGSALLSLTFIISSGMCLLTTRIIKKIGFILLLIINYSAFCIFLSAHMFPSLYILVPAYIIFGLTLGPAWISKLALVVSLACKISCHQHETGGSSAMEQGYDEHKIFCSRDESVRRLARWYQAAQDFGIIIGAIISAILLSCTSNNSNFNVKSSTSSLNNSKMKIITSNSTNNNSNNNTFSHTTILYKDLNFKEQTSDEILLKTTISLPNDLSSKIENGKLDKNEKISTIHITSSISPLPLPKPLLLSTSSSSLSSIKSTSSSFQITTTTLSTLKLDQTTTSTESNYFLYQDIMENLNYQSERYKDEIYDKNEHGERICGVNSCPVWDLTLNYNNKFNYTKENIIYYEMTKNFGAAPLMGVFIGFGVISLILTTLLGNIDSTLRFDPLKGLSDTLIFAGPMSYFIGTEQGYMLADFTKAYISCSLGTPMVAGALIGMGIMQLIASCTLSMLLRHTKRIVVIAAGFFFHACLLLVLSRWKPSQDDSALFYVIAAAWGVCNAVWETLCFALITLTHTNHVAEVISPLQGLRFLGLGITFGVHGLLCEGPKILILTILLVICVPPYALLEIRLESQRKNHMTSL